MKKTQQNCGWGERNQERKMELKNWVKKIFFLGENTFFFSKTENKNKQKKKIGFKSYKIFREKYKKFPEGFCWVVLYL